MNRRRRFHETTMPTNLRVLIIEDSASDAEMVLHVLRKAYCDASFERVETAQELAAALAKGGWDIVISDFNLPQYDALAALSLFKTAGLDIPFIVVSGEIGEEMAVALMRTGASDYLMKSKLARLAPVVQRELAEACMRREKKESEERLREVLENSLDASYKRNLHTNAYDYLSPVLTRISGYTPDEMRDLPIDAVLNLMHPDDLAEVKRVLAESMSGVAGVAGAAYQVEYRFKHKAGPYRWFQDRFTVMRDAEGQPRARIGSISDVTQRKQDEVALERAAQELEQAYDATIEGWSRALDLRDHATEGHSLRVADLCGRLARASRITAAALVHIRRGALLHDIGKIAIPDNILLKSTPLSAEEWVIMRKHPQYAYDMLAPITYLRPALDIPYCHHEYWDGTGYPRGLKGEEIPLAARLFAVVDVWDAMCSQRPYHPARPEDEVRQHIADQAGSHFDPQAVELFLDMDSD